MPSSPASSVDPQLSGLDEAGAIELCRSLADYGEAGSLNADLMLRVGHFATSTFPRSLDVLLSAARMYQMGGDLERARATLAAAGKLSPDEPVAGMLADPGERPTPSDGAASGERSAERPTPSDGAASGEIPAAGEFKAAGEPTVSPSMVTQPTLRAVRVKDLKDDGGDMGDKNGEGKTPPGKSLRLPPRTERSERTDRASQGGEPTRARVQRFRFMAHDDPQRRLDPYELVGEIASGGMATVYLGRRAGPSGFQRLVAIKRLHPHLAREDHFIEMFLDEARLAAGIHHPHVVPILEVGQSESDQSYYLVMPFVEGETLANLTARAHARGVMLPRIVAVRIVLDALAGLHAAHQLKDGEGQLVGLVHRDCTPQNILVGVDGASRITDFGVARASARLAITRPLTVKGKVAYLSPEQATAADLDRRSDIFTMGIVLWEALAGRQLFIGDSDAAIVSRLLTKPIPSLRNYAKDISPELDEVCGRALQRNRSRRYSSAAAMAEALERAAISSLGSLGSHNDVGRCVELLLGEELDQQRDALNAWLAQSPDGAPLSRRRSLPEGASSPSRAARTPSPPSTDKAEKSKAEKSKADTDKAPDTARSEPVKKGDAPEAKKTGEAPAKGGEPAAEAQKSAADDKPSSPDTLPSPLGEKGPDKAASPAPARSKPAFLTRDFWTRKRLAIAVMVLGTLFMAGTFPIWFPRANRLRHKLMGHPLPPANGVRPRPSGAPRPRRAPSAMPPGSGAPAPSTAPPAAPSDAPPSLGE